MYPFTSIPFFTTFNVALDSVVSGCWQYDGRTRWIRQHQWKYSIQDIIFQGLSLPPHSIHMFLMWIPKSTATKVPETPSDLAFTLMNLLYHSVNLCTMYTNGMLCFSLWGHIPLYGNRKQKPRNPLLNLTFTWLKSTAQTKNKIVLLKH